MSRQVRRRSRFLLEMEIINRAFTYKGGDGRAHFHAPRRARRKIARAKA